MLASTDEGAKAESTRETGGPLRSAHPQGHGSPRFPPCPKRGAKEGGPGCSQGKEGVELTALLKAGIQGRLALCRCRGGSPVVARARGRTPGKSADQSPRPLLCAKPWSPAPGLAAQPDAGARGNLGASLHRNESRNRIRLVGRVLPGCLWIRLVALCSLGVSGIHLFGVFLGCLWSLLGRLMLPGCLWNPSGRSVLPGCLWNPSGRRAPWVSLDTRRDPSLLRSALGGAAGR